MAFSVVTVPKWSVSVFLGAMIWMMPVLPAYGLDQASVYYLDGLLYDRGQNLVLRTVTFTTQILDENETCVLYEEAPLNVDLSLTQGSFQIPLGVQRSINDPGLLMADIYANTGGAVTGLYASNGSPGCSYTSTAGAERRIRIRVEDGGVTDYVYLGLGSTPSALVSQSLQGYTPSDFLKIDGANNITQSNIQNLFSGAGYNELLALVNGTSDQYSPLSTSGASSLPSFATATPPSTPNAGDIWYDSGAGKVKYYDGSTTQVVGTSAGSALVEADIPELTSAGNGVDGGAISRGTIGGSTAINTSGSITTSASVTANALSTRSQTFYDSDDSNSITINPPATTNLTANYVLTLPTTAGSAGQVLQTDGGGALSWVSATGGTGDLKSDGTVAMAANFNMGTSYKIVNLAAPTLDTDASTKKYVDDSITTATAALTYTAADISNTAAGNIIGTTVQAAINELDSEKQAASAELTGVSALAATGLVERTGAGSYSAASISAAGKALIDDATVGDQRTTLGLGTAALKNAGAGLGNIPTLSAALSARGIMISDGTGAGIESVPCGTSQYLQFNGTSWVCTSASLNVDSAAFHQNGDSFNDLAILGTNDGFGLALKTNGTEKLRILADGRVGIGTTMPSTPLHVRAEASTNNLARIEGYNGVYSSYMDIDNTSPISGTPGQFTSSTNSSAKGSGFSIREHGQEVGYLIYQHQAKEWRFYAGYSDDPSVKMVVESTGNVGIGTTSPTARLDVVGTTKLDAVFEGVAAVPAITAASYSIPDTSLGVRQFNLGANTTITLPPSLTIPVSTLYILTVKVQQDSTGGWTLGWQPYGGETIKWDGGAVPPVAGGAGQETIYQFSFIGGQPTWYASMVWREN